MSDETKTVPRSERFLNYCKGIGAIIAAAGSIAAIIISVRTAYKEPEERVAKQGYKAVETVLSKLSVDLRKEHDDRVNADKLVAKDIENIRSEMKMVVNLLSMQRVRYRPAPRVTSPHARPGVHRPAPTRRPSAILQDLRTKVGKRSAIAKAPPTPKPPPMRKLPSLRQIEQKAQSPVRAFQGH